MIRRACLGMDVPPHLCPLERGAASIYNAEAGTIPKEDLGTISTPVDEKKEVATEDLTGHVIADELMEPVVRLA